MNYLYDVEIHILVAIDTKETVNKLYNNLQRVFLRFFGVTVKLQEYYKFLDLIIGIQKIMWQKMTEIEKTTKHHKKLYYPK